MRIVTIAAGQHTASSEDAAPPSCAAKPMIARDPAMLALMHLVEQVAPSNATVLITGESGTGKELLAAHLHRNSGRHDGAFVVLNCATISDTQLESELFGHEKDAFPGATSRRIGKFEAASGGTLLLDEIAEMDLRTQAKVLRAVEQNEIDRVGGGTPVPIDVRIVATTNRNLQEEVQQGRFRADLFFRLDVITARLPPLRERPEDIPALAALFANDCAETSGRPAPGLSPASLAMLLRHDWPGNVRELRNVMHRAVLTGTVPSITPSAPTIGPCDTARLETLVNVPTAGRTIEAVEKDMILDTLCQCTGNRTQTASVLGISIRTLRNKLHVYERSGTRIPKPVIVAVT